MRREYTEYFTILSFCKDTFRKYVGTLEGKPFFEIIMRDWLHLFTSSRRASKSWKKMFGTGDCFSCRWESISSSHRYPGYPLFCRGTYEDGYKYDISPDACLQWSRWDYSWYSALYSYWDNERGDNRKNIPDISGYGFLSTSRSDCQNWGGYPSFRVFSLSVSILRIFFYEDPLAWFWRKRFSWSAPVFWFCKEKFWKITLLSICRCSGFHPISSVSKRRSKDCFENDIFLFLMLRSFSFLRP